MKREHTSTTSEAIWPWRLGTAPKTVGIWKKALLQSLVAATVASMMFYLGHTLIAVFIWTIAAVLAVSGFFMRAVYHKIESFGQKFGRLVAILLSWLLLVPFYYLFFCTMAFLFKGKAKKIFSPPKAETLDSYWVARAAESDTENYRRQY